MLTPAMIASSTSVRCVIFSKASSMQVFVPPFLNQWPFEEETTTALAARCRMTAGASTRESPGSNTVIAPNAVVDAMNSRRCMVLLVLVQIRLGSLYVGRRATDALPRRDAGCHLGGDSPHRN